MVNKTTSTFFKYFFKLLSIGIVTYVFLLIHFSAEAAPHLHLEKEYQNAWCAAHGGVTEYVLDDQTRVDCLTEEHAIEFEFAEDWAQAIGQARFYAVSTRKKPGIVLIIES